MGDYDLHIGIYGDDSNFTSAMSRTRDQVRKTAREVEQSGMSIEQMFNRIKIAAAGALAGFSVKEFASKVVQVRGEFQQLEVAFNTMLGSAEKASSLMQQLTKTAAMTPFDLQGVTQGAKQLLAYGVAAEDVNDTLVHLGDIAAGLSIPLGDLVYLYGTTMTQGRMFTQDLRQFMGRGIPIAEELAKQFGVTKDKVQELVSTGKVGAKEFNQAILSMSTGSGKFAGLMEAQSKTITGQISNIEDAIDVMFNEIGQKSEGIINGTLETVSLLVENYEKVGKVILGVVSAYGAYKAAVLAYIAIQKVHNTWIALEQTAHLQNALATDVEIAAKGRATVATVLFDKAQAALNKTMLANPYVLAGMAIIGLTAIIYKAVTATDEFDDAQERLREQAQENEASVLKELNRLDELNRKLLECEKGSNEYKNAKQAIIDQFGQYYSGLDAEIEKVGNLSGVYDQLTESIRRSIGARNLKSFYDKEMDNYDKTVSGKLDKAYNSLKDKYGESEGSRLYHNLYSSTILGNKNALSAEDIGKLQKTTFWDVRWGKNAKDGLVDFRASLDDLREDIYDAKAASDKALKEYKDMYEITDEQWNEVLFGGKTGGTSPVPGSGGGGKGGKKGGGRDNTAEQEAQRRQKLFEIEQRELERQAKERANLASFMADLEIASEADASRREQLQREKDHQASLAAIDRQVEEWKKANYEAAKEKWEAANKDKKTSFSDTEEGKAGWQGQQLTGVQDATRLAMIQAENAKEIQAARERAESLVASHQSYTDRKLAIDKQYAEDVKRIDAEIAAAEARGDNDAVAALQRSKRQAATDRAKNQSALSLDILKESPEYIRAFEDLEQTSSETLEYLIEEFEKAKAAAAQSLDPKDLKEYTDTIQRMQDEISSRNPFKTLKKSIEDLRKSEKNVKEAKNRLDLVKKGVAVAKSYRKEGDKMVAVYYDEADAQKEYNESQDDFLKKHKKVQKSQQDLQKDWSELGQQVQQLGDQMGGLAGECVSMIGGIMNFAVNISQTIDIVTATTAQGISAIEKASAILAIIQAAIQIVQAMASLLSGIFGNSDNGFTEAKAQYDNLSKVWDELIDKKREYLNESWGNEAKNASKEALELLKAEQAMNKVVAEARLGAGASAGSRSYGYRMWQGSYKFEGKNWQDVAGEISRALGVSFNGMSDMLNMSAEQLEWIKKNYTGLWANMDGDFQEALENIITFGNTEAEILEELKERITGSSLSEIYDSMMDSLYELANGSEDVMDDIADNWQEMINQMVVNNILGTKVKEELNSWYEELYKLQDRYNDNQLTNSAYQQELERLKQSYNDIVTSSQQEIENFRQMGIIKTIEEAEEETEKYFEDILDSWKDTLTDMESTTKDWKNTLIDQIFSDLVESTILNAPLTVGKKTFENFEKYLQDWTKRYKNTIEDATLSDEERNRRLKELIDEQTTLREQQAEKTKQLAESIGKDMSEAVSNSLDELGDSLIEGLLANTEAVAENAGKQIALTLIKEMLQTMLASEKYAGRMKEIKEKWQQLLNGEDVSFTMNDVLQDIADLNKDIANDESISALAKQYKELNKQVENTQTVFNDLHNTFLNTLTDINSDAESFRKTLEQTMLKDFIDKQVFDVPITVNGMPFDDFNAYVENWNERYANEVKEGNREAIDALLDELVEVRRLTLKQAEELRNELEELNKKSDETFKGMTGSFISSLMDSNKTAVDWAQDIGKTMAQKIIEQMVSAKMIQPLLDDLQLAFNAAMGAENATYESVLSDVGVSNALSAIKSAFPGLQSVAQGIMESLGLKKIGNGFSNLSDTFVKTLVSMDDDAHALGKDIAVTMMEQMLSTLVDKQYADRMKEINEEWAFALESGDVTKIEAIKQKVVDLYETIGNDGVVKKLTDDIKALTANETTPFDNLRSSYLSALTDMNKSTEDFTKEISEMIAQSFIDSFVLGDMFDERIEEWKKRYKDITSDTGLSEEERLKQLRGLSELIAAERESMQGEVSNIYDMLGIKSDNDKEDQQASLNMADKATYDQFELYLGIATAQQIAIEQGNEVRKQILSTLQTMSGITSPNGDTVKEIRSMLRTTNEHLYAIKSATEGIRMEFMPRLQSIDNKLSKL